MLDIAGQESVLLALTENCSLQDVRLLKQEELAPLKARGVTCAVDGRIEIAGKSVSIRVGIDIRFPLSLPIIFLAAPDALGFIPHVEVDGDGYVCYAQQEGLLLNSADALGILQEAIVRALDLLERGVSGENRWDFMDEFGAYWNRVAEKPALPSYLHVDDELREVYAYRSQTGYALVTDREEDVRSYYNGSRDALEALTRRTALYVPLPQVVFVLPPRRGRLWNVQEIRKLVRDNLSERNIRQLERLGKRNKSEELVILALKRRSGGFTLVGLLFRGVDGGHPLISGTAQDPPKPILLQRYDVDYLIPRGGGRTDFRGVRVLIAGCGAVGGHIAFDLARLGIERFTLVDHDEMQLENTFRHVLGNSAVGQPKVMALRKDIAAKYPYVSISTYQQHIEDAISRGQVKMQDFDLAIFALGNPTVELYINRLLHDINKGPKAVFTWLEPYGIGGHALLTRPDGIGCLHCLYTSASESDSALHNRAAFAEHDQFFSKDDLGCGSLYTPFGALDAQRTATMAVGLAIDAIIGREPGNPLLSWKGPDDDFVRAGFEHSSRYQLTSEELFKRRYDYARATCPVCGGN